MADDISTEASPTTHPVTTPSVTTNATSAATQSSSSSSATTPPTPLATSSLRSVTRNRGVIFPSVKNKPSPANSTFTTADVLVNVKDVKVREWGGKRRENTGEGDRRCRNDR